MAKDPAFLFYTKDFITGIADLTMEERGQYISLLCLQHQKGHLSDKAIRLCVGNAAADVLAKFRQDPAGLWYNERLDLEIEKRAAHGEKQKQRALEGWKKRKNKGLDDSHGNATAMPLVNANGNGIVLNTNRVDFFKSQPEAYTEIANDELYIENCSFALSTRGWRTTTQTEINALLYYFLRLKGNLDLRDKKDVKHHFLSWLAKDSVSIAFLQSTAQETIKTHERKQRSQA